MSRAGLLTADRVPVPYSGAGRAALGIAYLHDSRWVRAFLALGLLYVSLDKLLTEHSAA